MSSPGGVSAEPGRVSLTSALTGEVVGSAGGVSSLGGHLGDKEVVLFAPWVSVGLGSMSLTLAVVDRTTGSPCGIPVSQLLASGVVHLDSGRHLAY